MKRPWLSAVGGVWLSLLLTGCSMNRDRQLLGMGALLYGMYLLALLVTFLLPKVHQVRWVQQVIDLLKRPICIIAVFIKMIGVAVIVVGVMIHRVALTYHLIPLIGGTVFVLGQCLRMWVKAESVEHRAMYSKAVAISLGFVLGLTYLVTGASNLNF